MILPRAGRGVWVVGVALLLFAVAGMVCSTLDSVKFQTEADEGFYLAYASRVAIEGPAGFPGLFTAYLNSLEAARYFPNPLRILTISLGAAALKLGGGSYFTNLALLSLAAFLGMLVLMFVGTGRAFGWRTAAWTLLLACAAPLHLALARRALSDTLISFFLMASLWLFLRAIWKEEGGKAPPLRWLWVMLSFAAALLVKESGFLLVPTALFFLGWRWLRTRRPLPLWPVLAVSALPLALAGSVMVLAAGGIHPVLKTAAGFAGAAHVNTYALHYQNGPWFRFLIDLLLLSPWPVICWLGWIGVLVADRSRDERVWFWALVPVLFIAMLCWVPAGKNARFILFLEMPMRLCTVLLLERLAGARKGGGVRSAILVGGVVLLIVVQDLDSFFRLFVTGGIYDPVSFSLLSARGFLPP
ncbi:MAG: glycosyltransferase family 39 protein [Candidatus Omnitrophota bacterium]|nr:glycosyltransferase family 39 protein [Candidatus Omnitrophota bacterium]